MRTRFSFHPLRIRRLAGLVARIAVALAALATVAKAAPPPTPRFLYAANMRSSTLSGWRVDARSGALTPLEGFPSASPRKPMSLCVDPSGHCLYAPCQTAASLAGWFVTDSGALQPLAGFPLTLAGSPLAAAVDAAGAWLYATLASPSNSVLAFKRAPNGALTSGPVTTLSGNPQSMALALDPGGAMLYTANYSDGSTGAMLRNPDGSLVPLPFSPYKSGVYPQALAVHPSGRFVYVPGASSNNLFGFSVDPSTRTMAALPGSPFPAGAQPADAVFDPNG